MSSDSFRLRKAVQKGDIEATKALIAEGQSIHSKDALDCPLICSAVSSRSPEMLSYLISEGAQVDDCDRSKASALYHAAQRHDAALLALLLDAGADPNKTTKAGVSPLLAALGCEDLYNERKSAAKALNRKVDQTVRLLIERGAKLDAVGPLKHTALHCALSMYPFNAKPLIEAGADVNAKDDYSHTPLMKSNASVAKLLIKAGADVHHKDTHQRSAIFFCKNLTKARLLKRSGLNPSERDKSGKTPLMAAVAERKTLPLIKWFAQFPENRGARDPNNNTALLYAAVSGSFEVIEFLASFEDPLAVNNQNNSLLTFSVQNGDIRTIKFAVSCGVDVNQQNYQGDSALHLATKTLEQEIVLYLLSCGANPNARNEEGLSPLSSAIDYCICSVPILEILLKAGADDRDEAIKRAKDFGKEEALQFLIAQ